MVSERISHYRIINKLGAGGMGDVYLAEDLMLGRRVAIKLLSSRMLGDENAARRLVREARAAATLDHPNICSIYEVGEEDSQSFIVMQYIEGETLADKIGRGPLKLPETLDLAAQILDALTDAHARSIIHRDIKPGNVMITVRGQAKLMDFGLAKMEVPLSVSDSVAETASLLTEPGKIIGTIPYMSPEQLRGEQLDTRSDLFSFGAMLYEMLSRRQPFAAENAADLIAAILTSEPPPLDLFVPDAPAELRRIVSKLLAKDKERRYQTPKDALIDLKNLSEEIEKKARASLPTNASSTSESASKSAPGASVTRSMPKEAGVGHGASSARRRPAKTVDSLAVLPLMNASTDPAMDYLSDGITESIINKLAYLPQLRVMARATVFRYKGRDVNPQEVGIELNVRAVLTGRVLLVGERLVISVELVDAGDGSHMWGEQYNRTASDIFAIEEEIPRVITERLSLRLSSRERKRLKKRHTENPEVYQLYLKGRYHYNKWTGDGIKKAFEYYQNAIDLDANYALAYAGIADAFVTLWWFGYTASHQAAPQARTAASKALEIDDKLSEAHTALGRIRQCYDWDWAGAEREFKTAMRLNANSSDAHLAYAVFLASMGRFDEAQVEGALTLQLDPLSLSTNLTLGWALCYFPREYDKTIEQGQKLLEMEPNFFGGHWILGAAFNMKDLFQDAETEHRRALELGGGPHVLAGLGSVYARWGKRAEALRVIDELKELSTRTYVPAYHVAMVYAFLDEKERAFEWLEKAFEERNGTLAFLRTDVAVDNLKSDPRLADLLRRIGLD